MEFKLRLTGMEQIPVIFLKGHRAARQGRTGPFLLAGLPRHEGILGRLLAGLAPADVCQSTTDFIKVTGLPRHGLRPCRVISRRPWGAGGGVLPGPGNKLKPMLISSCWLYRPGSAEAHTISDSKQ